MVSRSTLLAVSKRPVSETVPHHDFGSKSVSVHSFEAKWWQTFGCHLLICLVVKSPPFGLASDSSS